MRKTREEKQSEAQVAFEQWAASGTVPMSYMRDSLGDPLQSVSPNVPFPYAIGSNAADSNEEP